MKVKPTMAYTKLSLADFSNIIEVTNLLDCGVRQDIDWDGDAKSKKMDLFWLGDEPDPSAGLHGFCASPPFHTLSGLDEFCAANLTQYDAVASEIDRTDAYPEIWFWSTQQIA